MHLAQSPLLPHFTRNQLAAEGSLCANAIAVLVNCYTVGFWGTILLCSYCILNKHSENHFLSVFTYNLLAAYLSSVD
jgi:hypothetical protein